MSETGWRTIESAPKDGVCVLLWGEGLATIPVIGSWMGWLDNLDGNEKEGWREEGSYDILYGASHWMPLPEPPQ